ncbi:MAG: hypothetical protein IKD74_03565 [Clostridia bacterium]|nr:hypothetical protein [Clostridia bacterium]
MLDEIKKIQGINHNEFDTMINTWINSAKIDLKSIGIVSTLVDNPDSLIQTAIITYVLSFIDVPNSEMYAKSYSIQKDVLRHLTEYIEVVNGI